MIPCCEPKQEVSQTVTWPMKLNLVIQDLEYSMQTRLILMALDALSLGFGLQGLYNATSCVDNILGRFTIIFKIKLQE